jgi:glycosyltransferase involved in cell wall biosynthesis
MRLLYLSYGPQSGVTAAIAASLGHAGVDTTHANVMAGFLYQLREGWKIPNPRPTVIRAVLAAMRVHGRSWKPLYCHTTYAFDRLSERAGRAIARVKPDVVLQAGVLFAPGRHPEWPYHLYLDHTRAIAEGYEPAPGLTPPIPYDRSWRAREQSVYRNAAGIFTFSENVKISLVDDYGVDPRRVHVVGAGPNVEPRPGDLGLAREKAILFVGRKFAAKGGQDLLAAYAEVKRAHLDAQLWIVAESMPRPVPSGVVFHGILGKAALARLYARASVFALPTLREAFGLSLVEASRFELPVVATRIEAIPEIVDDRETGLLVPPRDPLALSQALEELLADPERARRMGREGRVRSLARFGWDRTAAAMLDVLTPKRASRATVRPVP